MRRQTIFLPLLMAWTLIAGLFTTRAVIASVPDPAWLEWEQVAPVLNNRSLPLTWHDRYQRSQPHYHLEFGTERDAVDLIRRARLAGVTLLDRDSLAFASARKGKEFALRELLASGVSPNAMRHQMSLLMTAAHHNQLNTMRVLIEGGANMAYQSSDTDDLSSPTDAAAHALRAGHSNAARVLFDAGFNPEAAGRAYLIKLFFFAIEGADPGGVRYFLERYDLLDTYSATGDTPLTLAVLGEHNELTVSELLLRGADPCKRNKAGASVEDILSAIDKGKPSYDWKYGWIREKLMCRKKKR